LSAKGLPIPDLLSEKEIFTRGLLPISPAELQREKKRGRIAFYKFGRYVYYKEADLKEYVERHRKGV
jgi:hypothetical protein